jgi:alginate O-acetyltransferase complex protein AlgI
VVFSSHLFMFHFLVVALACYYAAPRWAKHLVLTLLSYAFYGWANPLFVVLMFASTVIDYVCGLAMTGHLRRSTWRTPIDALPPIPPGPSSPKGRWWNWLLVPRIVSWLRDDNGARTSGQKLALLVSICSNLALLGFFKYFNFGLGSYNGVVDAIGLPGLSLDLAFRVTLPLGISFYTFQSMSYSIDVYRGDARAIRRFVDFSCYVSMFPQLVAGPIIRFQEVDDQLRARTHTMEKFARGVAFISLGLAKKVLLANPCGKIADTIFDSGGVGLLDSWYGVGAYSFQIYFDFSAYSDMAIGLGLMLGFVFAKNFDSPYRSASITEFWRRWHISLSTWLRDYLYIPLGGNRLGRARTYVNLAIVMLLGGLWHGAAWNFVVWGAIHGGMLALERARGKTSFYAGLPRPVRILVTYVIVLFAWVFFRADGLGAALAYCGSMLGLRGLTSAGGPALVGGLVYAPLYAATFLASVLVCWGGVQTWDFTRRITWPKLACVAGLLWLSLIVLTTQSYNPFIYFNF